ncbi:class I SAM-dependent methyltransferase [Candidatus Sororendozoicomonas aggregata]|uniref:class I SAM-dependent methyltransferase n=1 Tax=Candidatus Sororendozoicomonas aggregata TaxID=3073239 RepID=UPI002ED1A7BA
MKGRYILAQGQSDAQRLQLMADVTWSRSRDFLSSQGLSEGCHCLEVGCGMGHISEKLLEMVGKTGSVTGLDIDAESVQMAQTRLSQHPNVTFHQIDVEACDSFDLPKRYDFIYCRLLLVHLKDPLSLLKKLKPLLAPSGQLIVEDVETEFSCYPPNVAFSALCAAAKQLWRLREGYPNLVESLPRLYQQCQLSVCGLDAARHENYELSKKFYLLSLLSMKDAMLSEKVLTEKEFDTLHDSVSHFFDQPYTLAFKPKYFIVAGKSDTSSSQ